MFWACKEQIQEEAKNQNGLVGFIDPFISTADDHGQTDPAAAIPFGMVKPAPDTYPLAHSGYDYSSDEILGFSNTRFSGVGCRGTGGNIRILPLVLDNLDTIPKTIKMEKTSEIAQAGYYKVALQNGVTCQLTATRQVSYHKYTFPKTMNAGLKIDLASSFSAFNYEKHTVLPNGMITGEIAAATVCNEGNYTFFYALSIDKDKVKIDENGSVLIYSFSTSSNEEILVHCSLSTVSVDHAMNNLKNAQAHSFENIVELAKTDWENHMQKVVVETDDLSKKRLFYTHLYHTLQTPFIIDEPNNIYRGSDGKLYKTDNRNYYHGWSIWDTFRTKMPLFSLLYPNKFKDITVSLKALYKQGKVDWATETEPFLTVRTEHAIIVLLDAHRKGLLPFSLLDVYEELKQEALGYSYRSPDQILESSYDSWALAQIASELGFDDDTNTYLNKAMDYKSIWREKFKTMDEKSDIMHGDGLYEGTLWQYRWLVPFDINGIQKMMGGKKEFENQLDRFFEEELFNIGNQPDIQVPYLYAYTESPWKTQKLVHTLLNEETNNWYGTHEKWSTPITRKIFKDDPEGFVKEMDDDAGTMSSWYIWSTLGLYPIFPGSTEMALTTPQFKKITIETTEKPLQIIAKELSEENIFIQKVFWNGAEINTSIIDFNSVAKGGTLIFELGNTPNKNWGN
nr:GH92 family glycosyl hydrolase [Allomuricauda sp.]